MVKIYCLIDPRTDLPFYVGATKSNLRVRLNSHIAEATIWQPNFTGVLASKKAFINDILSDGLRPIIKYLILVNTEKAANFELLFYNYFTSIGLQLFQDKSRFIYNSINATSFQK